MRRRGFFGWEGISIVLLAILAASCPGPEPDQCTSGPCCDNGSFRSADHRCGETPFATESDCASNECGADVMVREQYQYCSGESAECDESNLKWHDWQVVQKCDANSLCQASGTGADCVTCPAGCQGNACIDETPTEPQNSFDLIDEALERGEITDKKALMYKVFVIFADERLPQEYHHDGPIYCGTPVMSDLVMRLEEFEPEEQSILAPFLIPPLSDGSWFQLRMTEHSKKNLNSKQIYQTNSPIPAPWLIWFMPIEIPGKAWIWWFRGNTNDEAKGEEIARDLAKEFEENIWPKLTTYMQTTPIKDNHGPSDLLDIFILPGSVGRPFLKGNFAVVEPKDEKCPNSTTIYMDYPFPEDPKALLAHEFMHVLQFVIANEASCEDKNRLWWMESTAAWAEYFVYDHSAMGTRNINLFFQHPDEPLESLVLGRDRFYGTYLWPLYLTKIVKNGLPLVRKIFEATLQQPDVLKATNAVIPGGFKEHWPEFLLYNYNEPLSEYNFYLKNLIETRRAKETYGFTALIFPEDVALPISVNNKEIKHLSGAYYRFDFNQDEIRSIAFFNGHTFDLERNEEQGFMPEPRDPTTITHASVQAFVKFENKAQFEVQDWTDENFVSFCQDDPEDRIESLVIIFGNSEYDSNQPPLAPNHEDSHLWVSNMGCYKWTGQVRWSLTPPEEYDDGEEINHTTNVVLERHTIELPPVSPYLPLEYYRITGGDFHWEINATLDNCTYTGIQDKLLGNPSSMVLFLTTHNYMANGKWHRGFQLATTEGQVDPFLLEFTSECVDSQGNITIDQHKKNYEHFSVSPYNNGVYVSPKGTEISLDVTVDGILIEASLEAVRE